MADERSQYDEKTLGIEDGPSDIPPEGGPNVPNQDIEGHRPGDEVGLTPGSLADNMGGDPEVNEDAFQDPRSSGS
jgi:hypothetical protein